MFLPRPRLEPQSCSLSHGPCPASPTTTGPSFPVSVCGTSGSPPLRLPYSGPRCPDARPSSHRETPGAALVPAPRGPWSRPTRHCHGEPLPRFSAERVLLGAQILPSCPSVDAISSPKDEDLGHRGPLRWGWSWRRPSRPSQAAGSRGHAFPPGQPPRDSLSLPQTPERHAVGLRAPHFSSALSAGTGGSAQVGSARRGQRSSTPAPSSHHSRALTQPSRHGGVWWPWVHGQEREHRLRSPGNSGSSPCPRPQQVTGQARCPLGSLFLSSVRRGLAAPRGCLK